MPEFQTPPTPASARPTRENARAPARTLFCSAFSRCTFSKNDARYPRFPFGKKSWRSPLPRLSIRTPRPKRLQQFQWANDIDPQHERVLWAAAIGDSPDRAVSVFAEEESAVVRHRHTDGARPNREVVHDEAGHEVLIFAGRYPVLQARADHLVVRFLQFQEPCWAANASPLSEC